MSNPTITTYSTNFGSVNGGIYVTLTGSDYAAGMTVTVGGNPATNVNITSATSVTFVTPAGTLGLCDITLLNLDGGTVTASAAYTYIVESIYHQIADVAEKLRKSNFPLMATDGNSGLIVTQLQVQKNINRTEAVITAALKHKGYVLPATEDLNPVAYDIIQKMCIAFTANDIYQILKSSSTIVIDPDDQHKIETFYYEGKDLYKKVTTDELVLPDLPRGGSIIQSSSKGTGIIDPFAVQGTETGPQYFPFNTNPMDRW